MFKKFAALAFVGLLASATAAHADAIGTVETFTFNNGGSVGSTPGNFGTVTLTQTATGVSLVETLAGTEYFVNTGAGNALSFNLVSNPTLSALGTAMGSTLTSGYTLHGSDSASPFENFGYTIVCGNPPCDSGGSAGLNANDHSLSFSLTGYNVSDFNMKSSGNHGDTQAYFATDICTAGNADRCTGGTGNVGSTYYHTTIPTPTPEPSSLMLLGTGIIGAAGLMRRRFVA